MSQAITDRVVGVKDDAQSAVSTEGSGLNRAVEQGSAPRLSRNAMNVLEARYLIKDETGSCRETPAELFQRVARTVAAAELLHNADPSNRSEWEARFYELMATGKFMPNSPTLMNAGREMGMLSACFVLPVRDSIDEIFDSIKHTALIQKAGGGTGFAFDELRPTGDFIKSSGGSTSGPISFWRAFSEATNAIQQGAFRRGANMGMMYIDHPDILKFLHAKQDLNQFTNYNISVKMTDEWMEAFRAAPDSPHIVRNPRTGKTYYLPREMEIWEYDIRSLVPTEGHSGAAAPGAYYTRREIWNIIVQHAWQTGEPGVVFMDRINQTNPTPHIGRMEATNPCGEQPLLPYEACNLGSINVAAFIEHAGLGRARVDWDGLRTCIHECTRFLDNVIDVNNYPLPEIDAICKGNRKIGLGVMGFADALFKLGVGYNTDEGVEWGERFMKFLNDEAHACSERLALTRGNFPNWKGSTWDTQFHRPMRNACCTTVAPTGTISIIADCSCGIEPLFSLVFYRNVLKGQAQGRQPMIEVNRFFERALTERGLESREILEQIATDGTLAHVDDLPDDLRRVYVCAHDVTPEWHVRMQAAFQKHCDASISKTINFPESASIEDVETIYRLSYDLRCKGVTVYRDGCRKSQPMALKKSDKQEAAAPAPAAPAPAPEMEPATLPDMLSSVRLKQMTPFGNMHVQVTVDPKQEREMEVFAQLGKGGDLANSDLEAICRLTSLWLRSGGRLKHVIQQLKGIGSSLQVSTKEGKIMSLGDGLARALTRYARAKTHFGLQSLLLGDFDPEELDKVQRGLAVEPANRTGRTNGQNGNGNGKHSGNGNGNGNGHTNGHGNGDAVKSGGAAGLGRLVAPEPTQQEAFKVKCPECQAELSFGEGCCMCHSCGYSHC
ncbi:MAG TPA: vitamin B12-dependent ribonucleotide reductase [Phycisphaerae bacterium]|nr:vitamin B12-dependent ribonucleotide reductase [Phycisphaerae bacterium]